MSHIVNAIYNGAFGGSGSGVEDGDSFSVSTSGSLTAQLSHNNDGTVSGTWSYVGSYTAVGALGSETGNVADTGQVSGTPGSLLFSASGGVFVNGNGQLSSDGSSLSFAAGWTVPGGGGSVTGSLSGSPSSTPTTTPTPTPTATPQKVDYVEGVIPLGFEMKPAGVAGMAAGNPLFPATNYDVVHQSPTVKPDIWRVIDAAGNYLELTSAERLLAVIEDYSKDQFKRLAPYFLAKAMLASDLFKSYNLSDAYVLSKKITGSIPEALDRISVWGDTIANLSNVYSHFSATGQLPSGVGAVGLDNWANELKNNASTFIASLLSGPTLGAVSTEEAKLITDTAIQGWELIINGLIDQAANTMGFGIQTTESYKFNIYTNEDYAGSQTYVRLAGGDLGDLLVGNEGDDLLLGGKGNDALLGGNGTDAAVFSGVRSDSTVQRTADGSYRVIGPDGSDTLQGIERLHFTNMSLALDLDGNAGKVARLLGAILGSSAWNNKQYIGLGLDILDKGSLSYQDLMQVALDTVLGSSASNGAVVNLLFQNLTGNSPSTADYNQFVSLLDNGSYTPASLAVAAAEHEINGTNIGLVGLAQTGLEYTPAG